jgi:allophanate hydrolase subunit 1
VAVAPRRVAVRVLIALLLVLSSWSTWRAFRLGQDLESERHALLARIAVPAGYPEDASSHVAAAVDANEAAFQHVILLATSRRYAIILAGVTFGSALLLLAVPRMAGLARGSRP